VFELLQVEWAKVHDMVHELLVVLEGTAVGMRLEQNVHTLKALLEAQVEAEAAWHCYRKVMIASAVSYPLSFFNTWLCTRRPLFPRIFVVRLVSCVGARALPYLLLTSLGFRI
jgi:hypothetical protein